MPLEEFAIDRELCWPAVLELQTELREMSMGDGRDADARTGAVRDLNLRCGRGERAGVPWEVGRERCELETLHLLNLFS